MTVTQLLALAGLILTVGGGTFALLLRMENRMSTVEEIVKRELTPNGGESLRDRVVRIEWRLWAHDQQDASHQQWDEPGGTPV